MNSFFFFFFYGSVYAFLFRPLFEAVNGVHTSKENRTTISFAEQLG